MSEYLASLELWQQLTIVALFIVLASLSTACLATVIASPREDEDPGPVEKIEALVAQTVAKEEAWIGELEHHLGVLRPYLLTLREQEPTLENIQERAKIHVSILDAERGLAFLRRRRAAPGPVDRRQNAATYYEGRA